MVNEKNNSAGQTIMLVLVAALILFVPLLHSGKSPLAVMIIELLGLLILCVVFFYGEYQQQVSRSVWWFIMVSLAIACAYLIPLPDVLWSEIPGRGDYVEVVRWLEKTGVEITYRSLALIPLNGVSFLLACLPPLAVFLVVRSLSSTRQWWLINVFLLTATLQAVLAMMQYFNFGLDMIGRGATPLGTYRNQNHLTTFMEMAEPLALALMLYALINPRLSRASKVFQACLYALVSLALTFIPLISSSRMGVALLLLSIILSFWVMTTPGIRKQVMAPIIALRIALLGLVVLVQLQVIRSVSQTTNIVAGMEPERVLGDLRWEMWSAGLVMIRDFAPFGVGMSTIEQVYRRYQSDSLYATGSVNHLHNDYLELVAELGVFGIVIIFAFIALYIRQWFLLKFERSEQQRLIQSGAGVGILIFLLYSLTEFNLHTPANVVFLSFLCGLFFVPKASVLVGSEISCGTGRGYSAV